MSVCYFIRQAVYLCKAVILVLFCCGVFGNCPYYSQSFAEEVTSKGDVNNDGKISSVDAAIALKIADKSIASPSAGQLFAADVNEDGQVTSVDAQIILQWAAQGLEVVQPPAYTDPPVMSVVESQSAVIDSAGGSLSLASGASLTIPAGVTSEASQITLSKNDMSGIDPLNKTCFQISKDISYHAGSTLKIPYSAILDAGEDKSFVEGVGLAFYDPTTGRYEMKVAGYTDNGDSLSIDIGQIRADNLFAPKDDKQLFVHIFRKYVSKSSLAGLSTTVRRPQSSLISNVPYMEQGAYGYCWAASTAMALNYYEACNTRGNGGEKPWDIAKFMKISDGGISFYSFYVGDMYGLYIKTRVNVYPERSAWISSDSLRQYLKNKIDAGYPVILYMTSESHAVLVVGYEDDANGSVTALIIHDPQNSGVRSMYYRRTWNDIVANWGATTFYYTAVINDTPRSLSDRSPVINLLGHKEESPGRPGLKFLSPMRRRADINAREIAFNWYDANVNGYGFMAAVLRPGQPRQELPVASIPSYYCMDVDPRVSNSDPLNIFNAKLDVLMVKETDPDAGLSVFDQEKLQAIPANTIDNVSFGPSNQLNIEGKYYLKIWLKNQQDDSVLDTITIPQIVFDKGITLEGSPETAGTQKAVKLKWTLYESDFDSYVIYRFDAALKKWREVKGSESLEKTSLEYTIVCENTNDTCFTGEKNVFGLAVVRDGVILITSDVIELPPFYSLKLTSPNDSGVSWQAGSTQVISWTSTNMADSYINIELYKNGAFDKIIKKLVLMNSEGTGSYHWQIPFDVVQGANYSVKIIDAHDASLSDLSDNDFTIINPPAIKIAAPGSGAKFAIGGWIKTEFTCSGGPDMTVRIDLYKGGKPFQTIQSENKVVCGVKTKYSFAFSASENVFAP